MFQEYRVMHFSSSILQWENSNETQVTLKDVQFDLSGQFYCEVSTDTPIFTKASADELMSVFCA